GGGGGGPRAGPLRGAGDQGGAAALLAARGGGAVEGRPAVPAVRGGPGDGRGAESQGAVRAGPVRAAGAPRGSGGATRSRRFPLTTRSAGGHDGRAIAAESEARPSELVSLGVRLLWCRIGSRNAV